MRYIPVELRQLVNDRAAGRCEYCSLSQDGQEATFHIDHVVLQSSLVFGKKKLYSDVTLLLKNKSLRM